MAELRDYLAQLDRDPHDTHAIAALASMGRALDSAEAADALKSTRDVLRERGELEVVARLFALEIDAASDDRRRADLLTEQGQLYLEELLDERSGADCFQRALKLAPQHEEAQEALEELEAVRDHWRRIVDKYLEEASASTDRSLTTHMYQKAAETFARYEPNAGEIETYLRQALGVDPKNRKVATQLERLYRRQSRWADLAGLLRERVDAAAGKEERIAALVNLADLAQGPLGDGDLAVESMKKVIAQEPAHPRALSLLADVYERDRNWSSLVMLYTNALKARRRGSSLDVEIGMLLQIAMLHWKRLENMDAAEEYFRRIRKLAPAHPAALDFYRVYYPARNETSKLVQALRQALKSTPDDDANTKRLLSIEIAQMSEAEMGNSEKAIDAWKAILRTEPDSADARDSLKRLYARTEKWNALLDLMKDELDRLPVDDVEGRVARLLQIVEIYRDRLKLDVMVINTYNSILALDPDNVEALDALASKYEALGRWNDLIVVRSREAELPATTAARKVAVLREVAALWIDRFGNYAQAIKPLEQLLEIAVPGSPAMADAVERLKEIYTRRRQWRALIGLLGKELEMLPLERRRRHLAEMAGIASDRLGDARLAIQVWNRVLELPGGGGEEDHAALGALAALYEREKRFPALAEIYRRQRALARDQAEAVAILERLGTLLAERIRAPAAAADVYREILALEPAHPRALRTMRELYAAVGEFDALEQVYGRLGQWEELVEAFYGVADRLEDRAAKLRLLERSAAIAAEKFTAPEKIARSFERVLSVDATNLAAARALVPVYSKTQKWSRLLAMYQILLEAAPTDDERVSLIDHIRDLCEKRLGSKALAFQWTARAYEVRPSDTRILADLERLGAEADAWEEVATILDRRAGDPATSEEERVRLLRELGRIASVRLHQYDRSQQYLHQLLELRPEDRGAMAALEDIATQQSEWPQLLKIYRRKVELEKDTAARIELLFKIAVLEEERVADLDAAAGTYGRILDLDPESRRALKAQAKLSEARGDWESLAKVLERELALAPDDDAKVALLLRLGALYENNLDRRADALAGYKRALELGASNRVYAALERFLGDARETEATRIDVARLLLPEYEDAGDARNISRMLEVLRREPAGGDGGAGAIAIDRRLVRLYQQQNRPQEAYDAALRVLSADFADEDNRAELIRLGEQLEIGDLLASELSAALERAREAGADPAARRALASELAVIYEEQLANPELAEKAWLEVLSIEPGDGAAFDALDRIYRSAEMWPDLRSMLHRRFDNTFDPERRKEILLAICELDEGVLDDVPGAIDAYRRTLEVEPGFLRAYKALERLYAATGKWRELEDLLGAELSHVPEAEQLDLAFRRAELRANRLSDPTGAIDLCEDIVGRYPDHGARGILEQLLPLAATRQRVARILEPIYEKDGRWRDLIGVLRAQIELAGSPHERVELLARVAGIESARMGENTAAFATWREALALDPADARARAALLALARDLRRWSEVADALEKALAELESGDMVLRLEVAAELARIYDEELGDAARAMTAYERVLAIDPGNPETGRNAVLALARLYEYAGKWLELGWILRRQAEWADSIDERTRLLGVVASLAEERMADKAGAISTWQEVLGEDSEHAAALDALERLYQEAQRWSDLCDILRRRVDLAPNAQEKKLHLSRISALLETELGNVHDAIAARLEILDNLPEDDPTLTELARLYRAEQRYGDLLDVLERRLSILEQGPARTDLVFEVAQLLEDQLARPVDALARYAQVVAVDPAHGRAIAAIERLMSDDELTLSAAEILEPLYAANNEYEKLADLLSVVAQKLDDARGRITNLRRVATIREVSLGDDAAAMAALREAAKLAAGEPDLTEILGELERLAAQLGREGDLIDIYQEIAPDVFDGDLQRRLLLDIADLARAVRNDVSLAREHYQRVLDMSADDPRAMAALESIYRTQEEWDRLHEILLRKADLAGNDFDARARALDEAAGISAAHLGRAEDAIAAWEQVLELAPENRAAADSLEKMYERSERWHDLTELIERRLGFAFSVDEAVALRIRLGDLYENRLHDPEAAVENYSAALGGDPNHRVATAALERHLDDPGTRSAAAEVLQPIYVARQDWPRLVRIYEIKLEAAEDPGERRQLTRYIARLFEDQLEDLDGAFRWYGRVFREDPGDEAVRAQLVRLAGVLDGWSDLANVYQEFLDDESGDTPEVRDVALALANIYDRRLNAVDRAHAAYRRVLGATPDDLAIFARLEDLLTRAGRWRELVEAYEEAIHATGSDDWRVEVHARIARVLELRLEEPERAIDHHRAIIDVAGDVGGQHAAAQRANAELDRLYQELGRWLDLSDLLRTLIDAATTGEAERTGYRLRLGELLEKRLSDVEAAIDQYEILLSEGERGAALRELERLVVMPAYRERISYLLEPVYRGNDEWRKLVVILDAQLEFVDDPVRRVSMLREIAGIHEARGGVPRLALEALAKAWREDISNEEVYEDLLTLAAKLGEWDKLIDTLEGGIKDVFDYELAGSVLARIAEIHEANRDDAESAIRAWRRLLEMKDDHLDALTALDTLLDGAGRHDELVKVIERRAELADDPGIRVVLLHRVASLYEESLDSRSQAVGAYNRVLEVDDSDSDALDALERLYRSEGEYRQLAEILVRKIELADTIERRRPLQFALASVYDTHLSDAYEAIAQMKAVLDEASDDREALAALDRLYARERMWIELLDVLDRRAQAEHAVAEAAELRFRAAQLVERELADAEEGIRRYAGVLEILPSHAGTRRALDSLARGEDTLEAAADVLERVYRLESDHEAVADLYERRLGRSGVDPAVRQSLFSTLADLHESARGDIDAAFAVWARALAEAPEDESVQGQLERLAGSRGSWEELARLYEERLGELMDPALEHVFATKLGSLYEDALGDLGRAAETYRRALASATDEESTLIALCRIYERSAEWDHLAEALARRAANSLAEDRQAELMFRAGDVRERQLGQIAESVALYAEVLERDPQHTAARAALERLLAHESQRSQIIALLEPLYESEGDIARLADLLLTKLTITSDSPERAQIYARVTELAETRLGDPTRALDAAGGWLEEDPQSEDALLELLRLAELVGRWGEVAARLSGIISSSESREAAVPLMHRLGAIQLERLGDLASAERTFRAILDIEPDSMPALGQLEIIYRQRGDSAALCGVLVRRGELAFEAHVKRDCFAEVARLREQMGDDSGAIEAWRQVIELEEGDVEAHGTLAAIFDRLGRWSDLIELLQIAVRFADQRDEVAIRTRIATLYSDKLDDLEQGAEAWQAVLDIDSSSLEALRALEIVQSRREDWLAVQEVLARQLDLAASAAEKIALLGKLARVAEQGRSSVDEATGYLKQILDIDENHQPTYEALESMLRRTERWHELVDLFERASEVAGIAGDVDREVAYLARAADVWEGPLENPDAAGDILEKILNRDPRYVPALTRLAKIYEGVGDWQKCGEVLQKALELGPVGTVAADLHYRLGEVARQQNGDVDAAMASFQTALGFDARHPGALAAIEQIARERDDWKVVAQMLSLRLEAASDPAQRLSLTLELCELYTRKLGSPDAVIPLLESAVQTAPDDVRVIGPLADVYFAAGRYGEAGPMFEKLAEDAKKGRRMKDVARYRQRLGGVLEAQGQTDGALGAYEEAFRIDPTNVSTMAGLGRLYMERSDWDKARRVYRSMVLQTIDPEVGITKAIVYYNLGLIHLHLDEARQAKGMFQRGLELEPNNAAIKQALSEL